MTHLTKRSFVFPILLLVCGCSVFSKPTVKIKAAIVYKMGGAQPVARTTFYLTNDDLISLAQQAGLKGDIDFLGIQTQYDSQVGGRATHIEDIVRPGAISTLTTDFDGNGSFENISAGKYSLIGVTQTRGGIAIWNMPVTTSEQTILVDQGNAAYVSQ
jgi:hypothetical protein